MLGYNRCCLIIAKSDFQAGHLAVAMATVDTRTNVLETRASNGLLKKVGKQWNEKLCVATSLLSRRAHSLAARQQ